MIPDPLALDTIERAYHDADDAPAHSWATAQVPALVAEVRRLRADRAELRERLTDLLHRRDEHVENCAIGTLAQHPHDLLTSEEHAALDRDLAEMARLRRRAQVESAHLEMP